MKTKLDEFHKYLLSIKRSNNYYFSLRPFINWLEEKYITLEQIDTKIITEYISLRFKSANSINLFKNAGRSFYKFLDIKDNPFQKIEVAKVPKKFTEYITAEQKNEIIAGLITHNRNRHLSSIKIHAIVNCLFYTGLRKMELCNLRRENDFDFEKNHLLVRDTKSKVDRIITFCPELAEDLKNYFASEPQRENAFNIDRGFLNRLALKIKAITGRNLNIHSWRHSYCHYYSERIPLTILQT